MSEHFKIVRFALECTEKGTEYGKIIEMTEWVLQLLFSFWCIVGCEGSYYCKLYPLQNTWI